METEEKDKIELMTVSDWVLTLIILAIPVVGFIMLFVWAFGSAKYPSRSNWAKAMLLLFAVTIILAVVLFFIFRPFILGLMNEDMVNSGY